MKYYSFDLFSNLEMEKSFLVCRCYKNRWPAGVGPWGFMTLTPDAGERSPNQESSTVSHSTCSQDSNSFFLDAFQYLSDGNKERNLHLLSPTCQALSQHSTRGNLGAFYKTIR